MGEMKASMAQVKSIQRRIRIGVTGHRTLDDPEALQALVKKAIDAEAERLLPEEPRQRIEGGQKADRIANTFSVLSPLAEGADRVVARAVLEYPGARLDVVLPLALEDYLEDFATEASRKEFEELLGRCDRPVFMRARRIAEESRDAGEQAAMRKEAYAQAGRYVVDHCELLVAVWDGEPSSERGGTAGVVQYSLEQNRPVLRVWGDSFEVLNRGNIKAGCQCG
jgi:hypothetical protein